MRRMYDENEIKNIASESGSKLYLHNFTLNLAYDGTAEAYAVTVSLYLSTMEKLTKEQLNTGKYNKQFIIKYGVYNTASATRELLIKEISVSGDYNCAINLYNSFEQAVNTGLVVGLSLVNIVSYTVTEL